MQPNVNPPKSPSTGWWITVLIAVALGVVAIVKITGSRNQKIVPTEAINTASTTTNLGAAHTASILSSNTPAIQPSAVWPTNESAFHRWSPDDARDTNVIRQLAHNDAEYQRMLDENARIHRRQLVYRKDTAAAVMQRARLSGKSVTQLTLPGLDGQEHLFAVEQSDLELSKQVGSFRGHLVGKPNSMVTLAYKFGREAFTILSPDDGVYLQGHPREPGEVVIVSFEPETFWPQPGGEPIKPTQK